MTKQLKTVPQFQSEAQEDQFWQTADSGDYINYSKFKRTSLPNLKLTTKPITIRLPEGLVDQLKLRANRMDIPYQSLIKQYLHQAVYGQP